MEPKRTVAELWQDYLFLTREMVKFLAREEIDILHGLIEQREKLQAIIEDTPDEGFRASKEGQRLLAQIQQENQALMKHFQLAHNKAKHHHQVAEAYTNVIQKPLSKRNWES